MIRKLLTNHYIYKVILPVIILFIGIIFRNKLQELIYNNISELNRDDVTSGVFTAQSLSKYNGITKKKLYVAILGVVFDVTESPKHYAKDANYHYFAGKDGSRSLVTGDFKDESTNKDHVLDLPCADIFTLLQWKQSFEKKYKKIGILSGRYYDQNGEETAYSSELSKRVDDCNQAKEESKRMDIKYPPCNSAWSEDEGTKVWCTNISGGIKRSWVGVPRQLFTPGHDKPKCVCINLDNKQDLSEGMIKKYKNCAYMSTVCYL